MRTYHPIETMKKTVLLESEKKCLSAFKLMKNKIDEIRKKLHYIKDKSFTKAFEILIGKKLFEFGLLTHPSSFRNEKIEIKKFFDRQLIKIILKKNQKLSFKKAIDLIEKGKVSIKANTLLNPMYMLRRAQENKLDICL
mmetsp:Transcript_40254/g.82390  ORF Transcript_40254/g.82390 Transcript_40254/m.82390 type:complete len:139 (-) Transcript_40254:328-744(-)